MKINKIILENFKSFFGQHEINFKDSPNELSTSNISFLIGLNGSGKSNFLESLHFLVIEYSDAKKFINLDASKKYKNELFATSALIELDYSNDKKFIDEKIISYLLEISWNFLIDPRLDSFPIIKDKFDELFYDIFNNFFKKIKIDYSKIKLTRMINVSKDNNLNTTKMIINFENIIDWENFFTNYIGNNKIISLKNFCDSGNTNFDDIILNILQAKLDTSQLNANEIKNLVDNEYINENKIFIYNVIKIFDMLKTKYLLINELEKNMSISIDLNNVINIKLWKFSNHHMLPTNYKLDGKIKIPIPLNNIFNLIGKNEKEISKSMSDTSEREEILDSLIKKTNEFIYNKWPDFKNADLSLNFSFFDGNMDIKIRTNHLYNHKELNVLSDGYKQFLSILLTIGMLDYDNSIILLDEPEIHLHPSSIVSLRELLISFARKNNSSHVFISTHSVNMIEKSMLLQYWLLDNNLDKKNNNQTSSYIEKINLNSEIPVIIKQAMGVDFFSDFFYRKNCLFVEGEIDKKIVDKIFKINNIDCSTLISYGNQANVHFDSIKLNFGENYFKNNVFILLDGDDGGLRASNKYIKEYEFDKQKIITLKELMNVKDNIEIEFLYKENIYKDYCKDKKESNRNNLIQIKNRYLNENLENLDGIKVKTFLESINKYIGEKDE